MNNSHELTIIPDTKDVFNNSTLNQNRIIDTQGNWYQKMKSFNNFDKKR